MENTLKLAKSQKAKNNRTKACNLTKKQVKAKF